MEHYISYDVMALRLALAVILGFVIGLDRELKGKPYGLRPYMMVSLASCAFIIIILELATQASKIAGHIVMDPGQIIQALIGAAGFLGAAAFLRAEQNIVGATTGTGIMVATAIGISCGLGFFVMAGMLTLLMLLILVIMGQLHGFIQKRSRLK